MRRTRREVLQAGLGVAAAGLLPGLARGTRQQEDVVRFAYFSDTHVSLQSNFQECLALSKEMVGAFQPQFAINGGDVTDYGWAGEFDNYDDVWSAFPCKVHHVPGNHDVRWAPMGLKIFRDRVSEPFSYFQHRDLHFFLLDSTVPLSHWGHFEKSQLDWLRNRLSKLDRSDPVFITTHHWVGREDIRVDNELDLLKVIEPYNVKLIFNGHGHNDLLWDWNGIPNTMNKGLYQGSYQRVEVDYSKGEVRLARRSSPTSGLEHLTTVPLAKHRGSQLVWSLDRTVYDKGEPVPLGADEHRWNRGAWIEESSAATGSLVAGANLLEWKGASEGACEVTVSDGRNGIQPDWETPIGGGVISHLILHNDRLLVSALDGAVYCLDAVSGEQHWRAETSGYCHSSPVTDGDLVVVGSADGSVYAYDLASGEQRWRVPTRGPVYASAAFVDDTVAIASGDGKVYGLGRDTGDIRWVFRLPPSNTSFCQSRPATNGRLAYFTTWDNMLYALDVASGERAWSMPCCGDMSFHYSPAIASPACDGESVYAVANGNRMYRFDADSGEERWVFSSPADKVGYSSPRVEGDSVYVGCLGDNGEMRCVDRDSGREKWTAALGEVVYDSSPALGEGWVAIGSTSGLISVCDKSSGTVLARHRMPTGLCLASFAARGNELFASSYCNRVFGFRVRL